MFMIELTSLDTINQIFIANNIKERIPKLPKRSLRCSSSGGASRRFRNDRRERFSEEESNNKGNHVDGKRTQTRGESDNKAK